MTSGRVGRAIARYAGIALLCGLFFGCGTVPAPPPKSAAAPASLPASPTPAPAPAYVVKVHNSDATRGLKGHQKPYSVNGERYEPLQDHSGYVEEGMASWYGPDFHGKSTSCGEIYDMHAMTSAHKILPMGVFVRVTNRSNGRSVVVRVNDRGPFVKSRVIDLSYAAARELDIVAAGTAPVRIETLGFPSGDGYRALDNYDRGPFTVQVGAFRDAENARRLADTLKSRHGAATIQQGRVNDQLFYRVRVGQYSSLDAADAGRQMFETTGYPSCFVVALE